MNIIMVTCEFGPYFIGGMGRYVNDIIDLLKKNGHNVLVCLLYDRTIKQYELKKVHNTDCICFPIIKHASEESYRNDIKKDSEHIKDYQIESGISFDLIHTNEYMCFNFGSVLAKVLQLPLVSMFHAFCLMQELNSIKILLKKIPDIQNGKGTLSQGIIYSVENSMFNLSNKILVASNAMKENGRLIFSETYNELKVHKVHLGIHPDFRNKLFNLHRSLSVKREKVLLFAGRLTPQKGLSFLISAIHIIVNKFKKDNFRLVIAGSGNYDVYLTQIYKLKIYKFISFVGFIEQQNLFDLYEEADICVMPSIWEPFGYSCIEMMSAGLPVIVSGVDGLNEIVTDGFDGFTIRYSYSEDNNVIIDSQMLAEKICSLMESPEKCLEFGLNG